MDVLIFLLILSMWIYLIRYSKKITENLAELKKEIERLRQTKVCKEDNVTEKTTATQQIDREVTSPTPQVVRPAIPATATASAYKAPDTSMTRPIPAPVRVMSIKPEPEQRPRKKINYEKLIGENLFGKIGILILILGVGLFAKYAIDNEWINETMRTILSFAVGSTLLFIARRLHQKYRTFSSLLAGGAFAIFYITTAIGYHYYGLFSQTTAFIILVTTTLFMSVVSILYDRRELAIISLTGGFLAPFLVSSSEGNYITLFTYILILDAGMFTLAIYKKWRELPIISFAFTWLCLLIYILAGTPPNEAVIPLLIFATGFYLLFLFPIVYILKENPLKMGKLLLIALSANNFIYMGIGIFLLDKGHYDLKMNGLLTLFIALVNLVTAVCLKKILNENKRLLFTLLGSAVTFVSITIPLQLEENYITIFWASEMVLLLWLFYKSGFRIYNYFSIALAILTFISWLMDLYKTFGNGNLLPEIIFLNGVFVTNLFVSAAFLGYALLYRKYNGTATERDKRDYISFDIITLFTSAIAGWIAFDTEFRVHITDWMLSYSTRALFISFYILIMSVLLKKRFPTNNHPLGYIGATLLNILLFTYSFVFIRDAWTNPACIIFPWTSLLVVITHLALTTRESFRQHDIRSKDMETFMAILNIISSVLLLFATYILLLQTGLEEEFSAGFSICLTLAGFIQMSLGMRLHLRILRFISIITLNKIDLQTLHSRSTTLPLY